MEAGAHGNCIRRCDIKAVMDSAMIEFLHGTRYPDFRKEICVQQGIEFLYFLYYIGNQFDLASE
jgi:hypothetical protein